MTATAGTGAETPSLIVITDLDGTLIDQATYEYQQSLPGIHRLQSLNIPLVLCSSKTYAEIHPLWQELGLSSPFIVENGGAIYLPEENLPFPVKGVMSERGFQIMVLGTEVSVLRRALDAASRRSGVKLRSFGDMAEEEIVRLTGLSPEQAVLASARKYDEPFVVEVGNPEVLNSELRAQGFTMVRGDRFFHVMRDCDKGKAVAVLLDLYRRWAPAVISVGLGNSANDAVFLQRVDRPFAIRNPDGDCDSALIRLPSVTCSRAVGPAGWRECVEKVLESAGR